MTTDAEGTRRLDEAYITVSPGLTPRSPMVTTIVDPIEVDLLGKVSIYAQVLVGLGERALAEGRTELAIALDDAAEGLLYALGDADTQDVIGEVIDLAHGIEGR